MPYFSIIIPSFNRAQILDNAINSILLQSFTDYEIIIVDDGSKDNTKEIVNKYLQDSRVRYYYQNNKGVCAARNLGATHAKGKYLLFLDSDDQMTTDALNLFYLSVDENNPDVLYGDMISLNSNTKTSVIKKARNPNSNNHGSGIYIPGAFCLTLSIFNKVGGYDESIHYGENTELKFRIQGTNPTVTFLDKPVLIYEASLDGGSKNLQNKIKANIYVIEKHSSYFQKNKKLKRLYLQNIAVAYVKLNQLKNARKYFWKAFSVQYNNPKTFIRFIISLFPFLPNKIWKK